MWHKIFQEIHTRNGTYKLVEIEGVTRIKKADRQTLRGFKSEMFVIWCTLSSGKSYPIAFTDEHLRDDAYKYLENSENKVPLLGLKEFFWREYMTDDLASTLVLYKPLTQVSIIVNHFVRQGVPYSSLVQKDAFMQFSPKELNQMASKIPIKLPKGIEEIWSKTLWCPEPVIRRGVTPYQFYKIIVKKYEESTVIV